MANATTTMSRTAPHTGTALDRLAALWPSAQDIGDKPLVWVNGRLVPKSQAMVSVYDHGLLYGDGVFEGIRIYKGKIFKCQQHLDRLYMCADKLHLKVPIGRDDMEAVQRLCIEQNGIDEGYIRLVITRGYGTLGLDPRRCPTPGVVCIADQIRLFAPEFYEQGMRVVVARRPKTPVACLDPRIKSLNYLNNILAKVEAIEQGCDECVMLSTDGFVTEGSGDNIFMVKGGTVYTPPHLTGASGSLEGITEKFVRTELIPACGLTCKVQDLHLDDLLKADEVFLTGTAAEIIGVNQIDVPIGAGGGAGGASGGYTPHPISASEGPITKRLRKKFRDIVTVGPIPED